MRVLKIDTTKHAHCFCFETVHVKECSLATRDKQHRCPKIHLAWIQRSWNNRFHNCRCLVCTSWSRSGWAKGGKKVIWFLILLHRYGTFLCLCILGLRPIVADRLLRLLKVHTSQISICFILALLPRTPSPKHWCFTISCLSQAISAQK